MLSASRDGRVRAGGGDPRRRDVVFGVAAAALGAGLGAGVGAGLEAVAAPRPLRLAAIDWAMLETAMALGAVPVAACELIRYRADAPATALPTDMVDLGLRGAPNFELLQLVRPDLILSSNYYTGIAPRLSAIAPVLAPTIYAPGASPFAGTRAALHALAGRIGAEARARQVEARALAELAALGRRLAPLRARPVYAIEIGDARHFRAFGTDSMFGDMLGALGLENAWARGTRFSFSAPVPLEALAERPEARIVLVGGLPVQARSGLARSVLWRRLAPVAEGRLHALAPVNPFGGLPSGLHFARALTAALEAGAGGDGA